MEEKERYGITDAHYFCDSSIFDTETDEILRLYQICDLLNQCNKRIKELEDEKKELEIKLDKCGTELVNAESLVSNLEEVQFDYKKENQQLKQQLHDLPKKIVEDIIKELENSKLRLKIVGIDGYSYTDSFLQTILKKYGEGNESNND